MEGLFFNVENGYIEALARAYKNALLTGSQYSNLTQCDTLEDLKLQLSATDYAGVLADINGALSTGVLERRLQSQLVSQFQYLRAQASGTMAQFMDYICYGYMIDNVALMITGTVHNRDRGEVLGRCHPLGWFDTLPTLSVATDLDSLYETVLVDTPLAPYFQDVSVDDLDDMNIEIVRNCLYRAYLEDFAAWCARELPAPSDEVMAKLLAFEGDKRAINICVNSLDTELGPDDKEKMLPSVGALADPALRHHLVAASDLEGLKLVVGSVGAYSHLFNDKSLEDNLYAFEMAVNRDAFAQQFTFSTVWALVKSLEQEGRNVTWIAECIAQNQRDKINNYVAVY